MTAQPHADALVMHALSIRFGDPGRPATVDAADLEIKAGEIVALVGESGSGKSLIAHTIAGILSPAAQIQADRLSIAGVDALKQGWDALRGRRVGIVFQNPRAALNPIRRVGEQIGDVLRAHTEIAARDVRDKAVAALAAVRIPDPQRRFDAYPGELSGGMCQRVMLAIALAGEPHLLIADEPTTGLDATTQAQILALIIDRARAHGMATLFITHDLELAHAYAERVVVMHAGQIVEEAPASALFDHPRHPYSRALMRATPGIAQQTQDLAGIPGGLPKLDAEVPSCRFADRCDRGDTRCRNERPMLAVQTTGHGFACWHPL